MKVFCLPTSVTIAASLMALLAGCSSAPPNPWEKVTTPASGVARSIGRPGAGCLQGASLLKVDGPGYRVMRLTRRRFYGHPELVDFIEQMGKNVDERHLPALLIGDMGMARGGPLPTGHLSHQIGLDADIWFLPAPKSLTLVDREKLDSPSVLSKDGEGLDPKKWTQAQEWILEQAASNEQVDRIFVNPVIKRELCIKYPGEKWLHKLRPWWGHEEHWHVRMKCPEGSPACVATEAIPPGTGCDSTLDWWFSEEAKKKGEESEGTARLRTLPKLPAECTAVLNSKE